MAGAKEAEKGTRKAAAESNLIVLTVLLLLLGSAAGFGYGLLLAGSGKRTESNGSAIEGGAALSAMADAERSDGNGKPRDNWRNEELVPLQPLVVRMSGSKGKWLRLEGAVAFARPSKEDRGAIMAQLGEDLMLFLASTGLEQIASPTGLEFLRDDMNDIVKSRTAGEASRLVLKSLVVE